MLSTRRLLYTGALPEDPPGGGGGGGGGTATVNMSQDEFNRRMTSEKDQGRRSATKDLLKKAGVDTEDQLVEVAEAGRKAQEAATATEDQARKDQATAKAEREQAAAERHGLRLERALMRANAIDAEASVPMLSTVAQNASDDEVKAAVDALVTKMPGLFGETGEGGDGGQGGDDKGGAGGAGGGGAAGGGAPRPPAGGGGGGSGRSSFGAGGKEMLERRFPAKKD